MFPWPASHSGYLSSPPQPHQSVSLTHLSSLFCSFISGNPTKLVHVGKARRKYKQGCQSWGTPQSMCCPKRNQLQVGTLTLHLFLGLPSDCVSWKINLKMQHPLFKLDGGSLTKSVSRSCYPMRGRRNQLEIKSFLIVFCNYIGIDLD